MNYLISPKTKLVVSGWNIEECKSATFRHIWHNSICVFINFIPIQLEKPENVVGTTPYVCLLISLQYNWRFKNSFYFQKCFDLLLSIVCLLNGVVMVCTSTKLDRLDKSLFLQISLNLEIISKYFIFSKIWYL